MLADKVKTAVPALFFGFASALAGILNYLFQVYASRHLSLADYGHLNSWIATLTLITIIGSFLQISSNFHIFPKKKILRNSLCGLLVFCAVMASTQLYQYEKNLLPGLVYSIVTIVYAWLVGQMLVRRLFIWVGISYLTNSIIKFLIPAYADFTSGLSLYPFLWSVGLSALPGILVILLYFLIYRDDQTEELRSPPKNGLLSTFIISSLFVSLPQIDVLVIREFADIESLGIFSQVLLLGRGIIFLSLIMAQILLPYQTSGRIHILKNKNAVPIVFVGLLILNALLSWLLGPLILSIATGNDFSQKTYWIIFSCVNAMLGSMLLIVIQHMSKSPQIKKAWIVPAAYVCIFLVFKFNSFSIDAYLYSISVLHLFLLFYFYYLDSRHRLERKA